MPKYKSICDFLPSISSNLFLEIDGYGKIIYANSGAKAAFSILQDDNIFIKKTFDSETMQRFQKAFGQNKVENFQFWYKQHFYNVTAYPQVGKVIFCLEDATELRRLSQLLSHTGKRLEFAERTAQLGYWELDLERRRFYWSPEMFRIFGATGVASFAKKNLIREQIHVDDLPVYKEKLARLLKYKQTVEGQVRIRRVDNGDLVYCLFKAGIMNYQGKDQIAGTFQNITPLINIQKQLEEARQTADKLNLDKSYFLAQASHDLRQPLQALNLFASLLEEEEDKSEQRKIAKKIKESCDNLNTLLTNLLDVSKLDSGGMLFERETFNLRDLIQKLGQEYAVIAQDKGIALKIKSQNIMLDSDAVLIERVLRNFLSNAFKYTKDKVILSCFRYQNNIVIRVFDNGIGIPKEEQDCIFEDFYQCRQDKDNRQKGAGLGLSIVKKIAGLLDGKVNVVSRPDCYTMFGLTLHP